jgi:prepilin-type N-terminal cleavage/methylation domain-containing protein
MNYASAKRFRQHVHLRRKDAGVSFLELLIVIAILALISFVAGVSWVGYQREQALASAARDVLSLLGEARGNAIARMDMDGNPMTTTHWGVRIHNVNGGSSYVEMFEGQTWTMAGVRRRFTFSDRVDLTDPTEGNMKSIVFEPRTGKLLSPSVQCDGSATNNCTLVDIISLQNPSEGHLVTVFEHGGIEIQ